MGRTGKPKLAHLHWDDKYGNAARDGGAYRWAVADVGYENLSGEAMYDALLKLEHVDTLGSYHNVVG